MVHVSEVSKIYKGHVVLNNIDLTIEDKSFVILTGRSGGGKTTLLSVIGGLTKPDKGSVIIDDVDIWQLSEPALAELRNRKLGFVFQFPSLLPTLNLLDNVLLPIALGGRTPCIEDKEYAESLLEMVNLSDTLHLYPSQISGGQQRRVAIARSLINHPSIILTDEPTGDLDERTEAEIMHLFHTVNEDGKTVIMVTHALDYLKYGQAFTLKNGRISSYDAQEVSANSVSL
ncbi:MAG: ABC transporter ATP-binding protein [Desulfovibrio sp.]|jgi:ABC-type lipoprotein export system ATPase subunit|nr:ABC transporter ATP-binding protein [Desulfovibrio sp.]